MKFKVHIYDDGVARLFIEGENSAFADIHLNENGGGWKEQARRRLAVLGLSVRSFRETEWGWQGTANRKDKQ